MKAKLTPVYFESAFDEEYSGQLKRIREKLGDLAEIEMPRPIGGQIPKDTDAVLLPVLVGEVYRHLEDFVAAGKPVFILTSEFMTIAMWDWEIRSFLERGGVRVLAPYSLEMSRILCRSLGLSREMKRSKFVVYQETPGDGMQSEIFKRFFWWEDLCAESLKETWGITVLKKSLRELGERAAAIEDEAAASYVEQEAELLSNLDCQASYQAVKMYMAISSDIDGIPDAAGVGTNCLNESFYCRTTPCLAWQLLYEKKKLLWACEADLMSLMTEYLVHGSLGIPVMMTNLYPFLMGSAAVKHEKIEAFPDTANPEDCLLGVHCGYFGCMPKSFSADYQIRPKVLEIVPEDSIAVDAGYPEGPVTVVQLNQDMKSVLLAEGMLEQYVGYEGSDCRRGAVIRIRDGRQLMKQLYSHHAIIVPEHIAEKFSWAAQALSININRI